MTDDLSAEVLATHLPGRAVRTYRAMASTAADAHAWARAGAPHGAVVVADYQAAAWRRGGTPWHATPGAGLGFSVVLRPPLPAAREGWLYVVAATAVADTVAGTEVEWPDEVRNGDELVAAVAVDAQLGAGGMDHVVLNLFVERATPPRGPLLGDLLTHIEARLAEPDGTVLSAYRPRCRTLGSDVVATLAPAGPTARRLAGSAVDVNVDGALVLEARTGRRVAIKPQDLGALEPAR